MFTTTAPGDNLEILQQQIEAGRRAQPSPELAGSLNDLGSFLQDAGRFADSENAYREAIAIWRLLPATDTRLATALFNFAGLRTMQRRPSDAVKLYREAQQLLAHAKVGPDPEALIATVACGLAGALLDSNRIPEAGRAVEDALTLTSRNPHKPAHAEALFMKYRIARIEHRDEDAERLLRSAVRSWSASLGSHHPTYASALLELAVLLSHRRNPEADRLTVSRSPHDPRSAARAQPLLHRDRAL